MFNIFNNLQIYMNFITLYNLILSLFIYWSLKFLFEYFNSSYLNDLYYGKIKNILLNREIKLLKFVQKHNIKFDLDSKECKKILNSNAHELV